ncbi:hypothetical protein ABZP36_012056 [Zizania latifolia]
MAHDPSLGYADYFAAANGVPEVDAGGAAAAELYGLQQHGVAGMFGFRGLVPAAAAMGADEQHAHCSKAAGLVDVDDVGASPTVHFGGLGELQHLRRQNQAPLSLSLHRPAETASSSLLMHQQQHHQQQQPSPPSSAPWQLQGAWQLRGSRFLLPTQQLLQEFCSLPAKTTTTPASTSKAPKPASASASAAQEDDGGSSSWTAPTQIQSMDAAELQRLKAKLFIMLEEVDRRYRRYCEQMRALAGSFEGVAGERAAAAYTRLASRTISMHFRSLRDGVAAQLQAVRKQLGEKEKAALPAGMTKRETPRLRLIDQCLRQHKAYQAGLLESHPWRPQRGLPERAVSILRAWLFEHFLHPYPSDVDKHILARQTGLSRSQVANWFINARVRLWKPMVEEMYAEEMKEQEGSGQSQGSNLQNDPNTSSYTSEGARAGEERGEQKPTRAQLVHDSGSLASVVSIGGGGGHGAGRMVDHHHQSLNFGMMDHLDFDAYDAHGRQGFGGGVSLTLGLQQQHADRSHDGVNVAFAAAPPSSTPQGGGGVAEYLFMAGEHQPQLPGHHGQFGAVTEGDAASASHYRGLSAATTGFHLLHDLAG